MIYLIHIRHTVFLAAVGAIAGKETRGFGVAHPAGQTGDISEGGITIRLQRFAAANLPYFPPVTFSRSSSSNAWDIGWDTTAHLSEDTFLIFFHYDRSILFCCRFCLWRMLLLCAGCFFHDKPDYIVKKYHKEPCLSTPHAEYFPVTFAAAWRSRKFSCAGSCVFLYI